MKRDDDLLRKLLFEFEAQEDWLVVAVQTLGMSADERKEYGHINLLCDAGFVSSVGEGTFRLTNAGHDYLSAIRDDGIWSRVKEGATKVGGMSIGMMKDLALAYVKQEAAEKLGIEL